MSKINPIGGFALHGHILYMCVNYVRMLLKRKRMKKERKQIKVKDVVGLHNTKVK